MKIAILCNSRLAIPTLQKLFEKGLVSALGITDKKDEVVEVFSHAAMQHNVPLQVFSKKGFNAQLNAWLAEHAPDVVFVITFPFRIRAAALAMPKHGFINFHFGLLPQMRGADPIFESIRQKKTVAGTTVHVMDVGYDTGPIIMREELPLPPHYSYGMLSAQLAYQGAEMCMKLVSELQSTGAYTAVSQNESDAAYYPVLPSSGIHLQWETMDSSALIALINSCNPLSKNGVPANINGWTIGVCCASPVNLTGDVSAYAPGQVLVVDQQNGLLVFTKDKIALKLDVVYTEEGYFPGHLLAAFGITAGMKFANLPNT